MLIKVLDVLNSTLNKLKGAFICTLIGHDLVMTQCFRCWKWDKNWMDQ